MESTQMTINDLVNLIGEQQIEIRGLRILVNRYESILQQPAEKEANDDTAEDVRR